MEPKQICWEDVAIGQQIPALVKHPTRLQLLMWGGAVDDYNPMHADHEIATGAGYEAPIVFGPLIFAFLEQMIASWMGVQGWLKKISVRHNAPAYAGQDVRCGGRVAAKHVEGGEHYVELEIRADYPNAERGTTGSAIVSLPRRADVRAFSHAEPIPDPMWLGRRARAAGRGAI